MKHLFWSTCAAIARFQTAFYSWYKLLRFQAHLNTLSTLYNPWVYGYFVDKLLTQPMVTAFRDYLTRDNMKQYNFIWPCSVTCTCSESQLRIAFHLWLFSNIDWDKDSTRHTLAPSIFMTRVHLLPPHAPRLVMWQYTGTFPEPIWKM